MRKKIEIEAESGDGFTTLYATPELGHLNIVWEPAKAQPQPDPWKRWRADLGSTYFFVRDDGGREVGTDHYDATNTFRYIQGNYFRTEELAERHAKRLRSMVPTCAMPKDGDEVWTAMVYRDDSWSPVVWQFEQTYDFIDSYQSGRLFTSKEAAEAWIAEFGDVWTSRVDGEGE